MPFTSVARNGDDAFRTAAIGNVYLGGTLVADQLDVIAAFADNTSDLLERANEMVVLISGHTCLALHEQSNCENDGKMRRCMVGFEQE